MEEHLQQFSLLLHHLRDQADAKIPDLNRAINRLHASGFINEAVFLGGMVAARAFLPGGPVDAGSVVVAVLRIPGGIGALYTDSEAYAFARRTQGELEEMAMVAMTEFDRCDPFVKANLLDQVEPLLQTFLAAMDIPDPK